MRRISWKWIGLAVVIAAAGTTLPQHALAVGNVTSADIKVADGVSGQNTSLGSGVKSGHLQNGAVTAEKIAPGAVTDGSISGVISASKLPVGTTAGTVAAGDHVHRYANVVTVAKSGGDFTDLPSAIAATAGASESSRWLVKVMPGIYDLPPYGIGLRAFVDLEGSGEGVTVLKLVVEPNTNASAVAVGPDSELRMITVDVEEAMRGVLMTGQPSASGRPARLSHVTVRSVTTAYQGYVIGVAVNTGSVGVIADSTIHASGTGSRSSADAIRAGYYTGARASVVVSNTLAHADGTETSTAIFVDGSDALVSSSRLEATGNGPRGLFLVTGSVGEAIGLTVAIDGTSGNALVAHASSLTAKNVLARVKGTQGAQGVNLSLGSAADRVVVDGVDVTLEAPSTVGVYVYGPVGSDVKVLNSRFAGAQTALSAQAGGKVTFAYTNVETPVFRTYTGTILTCAAVTDGSFNFYASACP